MHAEKSTIKYLEHDPNITVRDLEADSLKHFTDPNPSLKSSTSALCYYVISQDKHIKIDACPYSV